MDRGQKDENLTLIDELLALQKKFMQNAGKVSLNQQSNGGMRTLTFVVQIPDTVPKPPIKPKKRKSPSQKKRELERKNDSTAGQKNSKVTSCQFKRNT